MLVIGLSMMALLPSATIQSQPIVRTLSIPLVLIGRLPGSIRHSTSVSQSPTNCWSQSCSGPGFGSACSLCDDKGSYFAVVACVLIFVFLVMGLCFVQLFNERTVHIKDGIRYIILAWSQLTRYNWACLSDFTNTKNRIMPFIKANGFEYP